MNMKLSHFFLLALVSTMMTVVACKDNKDAGTTEGGTAQDSITSPEGTMTTDPTMVATPSSGTEAHYKCTKAGCTGSGAAQGKCPICGTDLVHNQAFHAQAAGAPGSSPVNPVQVNPTGGTTATPTPPSAQNAKGEYHYTCAKGHAGAASAGNCGTCGEPLAHNQAYHSN
jgi:hypothetical protein